MDVPNDTGPIMPLPPIAPPPPTAQETIDVLGDADIVERIAAWDWRIVLLILVWMLESGAADIALDAELDAPQSGAHLEHVEPSDLRGSGTWHGDLRPAPK